MWKFLGALLVDHHTFFVKTPGMDKDLSIVVFNALMEALKPVSIVPIDDSRYTKPPEIIATIWDHALDIRDIIERFKGEFNLIGYRHLKSRAEYELVFQVLCNSLQFIIGLL